MSASAPPAITFAGRRWSSDELAELAVGWLDLIDEAIPPFAPLTAMLMGNDPQSVALLFALSTRPIPVAIYHADPRAWRSEPPLPPGTPLFLAPPLRARVPTEDPPGLRLVRLPARPRATARRPPGPFLACPGFVSFTSGSTGLPKPVYIRTESYVRQTRAVVEAGGLTADSAVAGSLPLASHYGLGQALLLPTLLGAELGLVERFDHRSLLALFASGPYAYWATTPLMADILARAPLAGAIPAMAPTCHVSAGRLAERTFHAFAKRFGVTLRPSYGQTENGFICVDAAPPDEIRADCVGHPAPGIEVRVGDDPTAPLPWGRAGRVWFRSPWYMEGYGFPPRLAPREGREGWWPTADVGSIEPSGHLKLAGRLDDCFKTAAGYLVNPGEIVNALLAHPRVTDAAVLALPPLDAPAVGVVVESDGPLEAADLRVTAARLLPAWLHPRTVAIVPRIPRLPGGKVDRAACRALLEAAAASEPDGQA